MSRTRPTRPPARWERGCRLRSRAALEGRALAAAGERLEAVAALRDAEHELDACGSMRVRDEMRRELRRLGARAEPRGPAAAGGQRHRRADQARARDRRASSPTA